MNFTEHKNQFSFSDNRCVNVPLHIKIFVFIEVLPYFHNLIKKAN